jgi:hypothetical protein
MAQQAVTAPVTPTAMLGELRATRATAMAAEARILELAAEWADAHPSLDDDRGPYHASRTPGEPGEEMAREFDEDRGIPGWSWSATAPLAAALGRSTLAGDALIREALILRHRLPSIWSRLIAGELEAWRARRIAPLVTGAPDDVCEHVDAALAEIAHKVGATTLDKLLDEAMLRLHPEEREIDQIEALDRRHATLHPESINHTGVADMTLRGAGRTSTTSTRRCPGWPPPSRPRTSRPDVTPTASTYAARAPWASSPIPTARSRCSRADLRRLRGSAACSSSTSPPTRWPDSIPWSGVPRSTAQCSTSRCVTGAAGATPT